MSAPESCARESRGDRAQVAGLASLVALPVAALALLARRWLTDRRRNSCSARGKAVGGAQHGMGLLVAPCGGSRGAHAKREHRLNKGSNMHRHAAPSYAPSSSQPDATAAAASKQRVEEGWQAPASSSGRLAATAGGAAGGETERFVHMLQQ